MVCAGCGQLVEINISLPLAYALATLSELDEKEE
jgi:hypothetical protein